MGSDQRELEHTEQNELDYSERGYDGHRHHHHVDRVFTGPMAIVLLTEFCAKILLYMFNATLTLYALDSGGTATFAGLLTSIRLIASLLIRPAAGNFSDKKGRIPTMLSGAVLYCVVTAIYLLGVPVGALIILVPLQGVASCLIGVGLYSLAANIVPRKKLTHGYAYLNLVETAAAAISTTLAVTIRNSLGYSYVFSTLFGVAAVALICVTTLGIIGRHDHRFKPRPIPKDQSVITAKKFSLSDVIDKNALRPGLFYGCIMLCGEAILAFLVAYGIQAGIPNPGIFYTTQAVTVFVASFAVSWVDEKFGSHVALLAGFFFYFSALLGIFLHISVGMILVCGVVFGCGVGFAQPTLNAIAVSMAGEGRQGMANSTVGMLMDIGGAIGGFAFGVISDAAGFRAIYAVAAVVIALAAVIYLIMRSKKLII